MLIREDDVCYDNIRSFVQKGFGVHNIVKEQDVQERMGSFDSDYLLNNLPSLLDKMTNEGLCCFAELLTDGLLEFEKKRRKMKKIIKEHLPTFINKGNHYFQMRVKQISRLLSDPQYFCGNHDVNWATTDYKAAAASVLDGLEELPLATLSAMYRKLKGPNGYIPELGAYESHQKYHLIGPVRQQCMKMLSELHEGEEPQELLVKTLAVAGLTFKLILGHPSGLEFRKFSPQTESLQNDIAKAIHLIDSVNKVSTADIEALHKTLQQQADSGVEFSEGSLRAAIKNLFTDFLFECGDMEIIPEYLLQAVFEINKRFHESTCTSTSMEEMEQEVEFLLWMSAMTKQIVSDLLPGQEVDQDFAYAYMVDLEESDVDEDEDEEGVDLPRNFKFRFDDSKGLSESFGETNPFDFGMPISASIGDGSSSFLSPSSKLNSKLGSVDMSEMDTFEPKDSVNCSSCPKSKMLNNTQVSNGHEHQLAGVMKLEPTDLGPSLSAVNLSGSSSTISPGRRKSSHDVKTHKTVNDSARNAEFLHTPSPRGTGILHHKQCKSGNEYLSIQRACDETSMAIYGTSGGMLDELAQARNLDLRQDHVSYLRCHPSVPNGSKGPFGHHFLLFVIWCWSIFQDAVAFQTPLEPKYINSKSELASPPSTGLFEPIEISPAVFPHYPISGEPLPPMYPFYPTTYDPVLTGRCPVNFSAISTITEKTASDCSQPLAALVGNVICCPQLGSLLHIFQGFYSRNSTNLVLQDAVADDCFKDIISILASRGANSSLPAICSAKSLNLTGGSCPVKDITTFERTVNASKLLDACSTIDTLKECCRPICQPAIMEAAVQISGLRSAMTNNKDIAGAQSSADTINDCKGIVYSWLSRKLPFDAANSVFRMLSACKVNRVCPLNFTQPSEVIKACRNVAAPSPSCCSSLNTYIAGIQRQMLITNLQAIICSTVFGSMLQKAGVITNVYELCDVDLKDFSLQAYGQQGCLLRSFPADVVYDNSTGYSFTCDLSDNIASPWPSSSSVTSLSLCAPEMSLPALPTSETMHNHGCHHVRLDLFVTILLFFVLSTLLY